MLVAPHRCARRFRLGVIALCLSITASLQAATILVVNRDGPNEGFNDPTPASPVGGNSGTTVGQQRLIVFQRAAEIWGARLISTVPVRIAAQFNPLSCTPSSGVLGSAGPVAVIRDFAGAPRPATYYPMALANALSGQDLDPGNDDISATFNSDLGKAGCLTGLNWYYGLDSNEPANTIDLLDTILHEFGHGLGFISLVNLTTGGKFNGFNDVFSDHLEDHRTGKTYPQMTDAERRSASTATDNLHWVGTNVIARSGILSVGRGPGGHVEMYAPDPVEQGSSVSHYSDRLLPDELMEPFATPSSDMRLTLELFKDIGWTLKNPGPSITPAGAVIASESCGAPNGVVDPNETVSVTLSLRNNGDMTASNVVATLLPTGGVNIASAAQIYGALLANGPAVGRTFSFLANTSCGGTLTATLQLQDGTNNLGTVSFPFTVGRSLSFTNSSTISIPLSGPASVYPSSITVSGLPQPVNGVRVRLMNVHHDEPDDLDLLLVGPGGQTVLLMSDAGGGSDLSGANLTFDDAAAASLPDSSQIVSGTFRPTNFGSGDVFPSPAPAGSYGTALSVFNGISPNGTWTLYVLDDNHPRGGSIVGGWSLNFLACCATNANQPPVLAGIPNRTVNEGATLMVTNLAIDPDAPPGALTFSLLSGPAGAAINATNGVFSWTPSEAQAPGTNAITIKVSDNGTPNLSATQSFTVVTIEINQAPSLAPIADRVIHQGTLLSFSNTAADADLPANSLHFTLSNAPAGASIQSTSGLFTWTPNQSHVNTTNLVSVVVTDNGTPALSDAQNFSITVLSRPLIGSVAISGGNVILTWNSIAGAHYRVQYTTTLDPPSWIDIPGDVTAIGPTATKLTPAIIDAQRFYRVQVLP